MSYYEVTPWHCVGGQTGTYELESPWDTSHELILTNISGNGPGVCIISFDGLADMAGVLANFSTGVGTPGFRGMVTRFNTDTPLLFSYDPIPVWNRRIYIYIATDTGGKAAYVTAHFRRLAPTDGAYAASSANLAATIALGTTTPEVVKAGAQWSRSLAQDSDTASAQKYRGTSLRRHNGHKRSNLLERLTNS